MQRAHHARIFWTDQQVLAGLSQACEVTDPIWFATDSSGQDGWSLVCRFARPPIEQGNPSEALIHFLFDDAPDDRLTPGTKLRMFERATTLEAEVLVLD